MTRIIERPVFVFFGDSCLCKSFIASKTGMTKYETDLSLELPERIYAEVIVIGNRSGFTYEDVYERIYDRDNCKVIKVGFESGS